MGSQVGVVLIPVATVTLKESGFLSAIIKNPRYPDRFTIAMTFLLSMT